MYGQVENTDENMTLLDINHLRCQKHQLQIRDTCFSLAKSPKDVHSDQQQLNYLNNAQNDMLQVLSSYMNEIKLMNSNEYNSYSEEADSRILNLTELSIDIVGCHQWMFSCEDGSCIHYGQVFDGTENCADGSDELPWAGVCILVEGSSGGRNGSVDECRYCQLPDCQCAQHLLQCNEGGCVSWEKVCDGVSDCSFAGDEFFDTLLAANLAGLHNSLNLDENSYTGNTFYCVKNNQSIPIQWVNDNVADCSVGIINEDMEGHVNYNVKTIPYESVLNINIVHTVEDEGVNITAVDMSHDFPSLFCHKKGPHTFNFADLCFLDYDSMGELKFCRSGAHLKHCIRKIQMPRLLLYILQ